MADKKSRKNTVGNTGKIRAQPWLGMSLLAVRFKKPCRH